MRLDDSVRGRYACCMHESAARRRWSSALNRLTLLRRARQKLYTIALPAALLVLGCLRVGGQELSTAVGHYHLDVWRRQDAVRLAFVSNLVQTADGYLWLSSQSGLARFDGVRFTVFDPSNSAALRTLASLETYPVVADPNGALWIGSDAGLLTYQNRLLRPAAFDSAFATDQVNAAVFDAAGTLWAVTRSGRVLRIARDGSMHALAGTTASYSGSGITVDATGVVWVAAGEHAVYHVENNALSQVVFPAALHLGTVNRVYGSSDGAVWFGTATAIVRLQHGVFERIPLPPTTGFGAVSCFAVSPDGALWVGTQGAGLYRYDGKRFALFTTRNGLSDDRIVDILVDRSRNVWIATRDGLDRLRPEPFRTITRNNGLPADLPGAMIRGEAGAVWVAPPTGGLYRGEVGAEDAHFVAIGPLSSTDRVTALVRARDGAILTGWLGGSVRRVEAGSRTNTLLADGLPPVTDVLEGEDASQWIGTWHGLYHIVGSQRTIFTTHDGLPDDAVQRIFRDSKGTVWIATQTGIAWAHRGDVRFTALNVPPGAASRAITLFEWPATSGTIWIGSAQGLARVSGVRPTLLTTAQGLPENWVGAAEPDDAGHVWLAQLGGLTRVEASDLDSVANGTKPSLTTAASYEALDGMPGGDPSGWGHPWSFRSAAGTLWFAVGHGIVVVDPQHVERDTSQPALRIEQTIVDGLVASPSGRQTLGPDVRRLELRYTGIDLTDGPAVRFRYRLDGFDTTWTDGGTQRVASYTRLAPGRYRFRVAGRTGGGFWNPAVAAVEIVVEPPTYRRPWFILAAALAVAFMLWAAHVAVLSARTDAIRDERSRMAREIHDSLLQGFGGIALQLHAASARLSLSATQQPLLDRVLLLADRTLTQAREAVWDIRLHGVSDVDFSTDCADAARRLLGDSATATRVESRGRQRHLERTTHAEALRIVEEALTNVGKHAAAANVVVMLDYRWHSLRITITDDGRGFDMATTATRSGHWGVLGMRERASRMGGRLALTSGPVGGTMVAVDVRYPGTFLRALALGDRN